MTVESMHAFWGGPVPAGARPPQPTGAASARSVWRHVLLVLLGVVVAAVPLDPIGASAAAPVPASFARVAAVARAASIAVRRADARQLAIPAPGVDEQCEDSLECQFAGSFADGRARTLGAGVIVDSSGIALTSARAILLAPRFVAVLADGTPLQATLLALDRRTDVAVLKLQGGGTFPHLPFGDSELVKAGDWVIAVGAPQGLEGTVTAGVITATPAPGSGPLAAFLQTDAAIGGQSAGAPLVDLGGQIVGLCTPFRGDGVGYALPSTIVRKVYLELIEKGRVSRPWLGVRTQSLTLDLARALGAPDAVGVLLADVRPKGPGAAAGLRPGDIVLQVDTTPVSSRAHLERAVSALPPGHVVRLRLRRATRELTATVRLGEEPDDWQVPAVLVRARRLLGIEVHPITPTMGAVVNTIDAWSPAAHAGMQAGDVIREINRRPIGSFLDFEVAAGELTAGTPVLILVQRGDVALYVAVSPGD